MIISGHTDLKNSVANKTILEELHKMIPHAEIDYLDCLYSDFQIDIKKEQQKLEKADILVFQFPVFWYSMPSLLARWMEETFQHGWSHGSTGDKLKGKKLIISLTTGAPKEMYQHDGAMGFEIEEYLSAIISTCKLCQMEYVGYVYTDIFGKEIDLLGQTTIIIGTKRASAEIREVLAGLEGVERK